MSSEAGLEWITGFLESNDIPYLVCGGLAAIAYGSMRPLHDIDIYVPEDYYEAVVKHGADYVSRGPMRETSSHWDVEYVQFIYLNQKIEIGSSKDLRIYDSTRQQWHREILDFDSYQEIEVLGKSVRVMVKKELIDYKRKLGREVDRVDIDQIENT